MSFAKSQFLYALILVPLMGLLIFTASRNARKTLAKLGNPTLVERLALSVNRRGRRWQAWLWLLALVMLIVSLARPQWGQELQMVEQEGIEIMVALDVSQSMLAEDIKPNRLSRAKLEIAELMEQLGGNEIGLVLFSGTSFIQFPLTSDFATARAFLDAANPSVISRQGTAIDSAIRTAMTGFNPQRASQKVILIITDGESHDSDPFIAAEEAAAENVLIYTIGIGSPEGNPIPEYNAAGDLVGYKKDARGETVLSRLDEVTLQEIALATGGQYFRASASGGEIDALVAELDTLQKETFQGQFETLHTERFQGFLLVALLAIIVADIIPDRKRRA